MDKVYFMHERKRIIGAVMRLNRRSVTVLTPDGRQWNVAPALLTRMMG